MRGIALGVLAWLGACGAASAADPDVIAAPEPEAARFADWTGAYVSIGAGYGWLRDKDDRFVPTLRTTGADPLANISAGYLYQSGMFVGGVDGTYQYQRISFDNLPVGFPEIHTSNAWMLRGRLGAAVDRYLITANFGAVYADTNIGMEDWGFVAGLSVDYKLSDQIFAGVAYDHQFYRNFDGVPLDADIDQVAVRLGYQF